MKGIRIVRLIRLSDDRPAGEVFDFRDFDGTSGPGSDPNHRSASYNASIFMLGRCFDDYLITVNGYVYTPPVDNMYHDITDIEADLKRMLKNSF